MPQGAGVSVGGYCDVTGTLGVTTWVHTWYLHPPQTSAHLLGVPPAQGSAHFLEVPPARAHPIRALTLPQATAHFPRLPALEGGTEIFILAVVGLIHPDHPQSPRSPQPGVGWSAVPATIAPTCNVGSAEASHQWVQDSEPQHRESMGKTCCQLLWPDDMGAGWNLGTAALAAPPFMSQPPQCTPKSCGAQADVE